MSEKKLSIRHTPMRRYYGFIGRQERWLLSNRKPREDWRKTRGALEESPRHTVLFSLIAAGTLSYMLDACSSPKPFGTARAITRR